MTMEKVPPITGPRRVARSIGRGIKEAGSGFREGLGIPPIHRPTPREVGRVAGETLGVISEISFKDEEYFWGDWDRPRKPRKPTSRLSPEVQSAMISCLGDFHPNIYMSIWRPGVGYSEFIGTLRQNFPEIYEEMKDYAYSFTRPSRRAPYEREDPYERYEEYPF